MTSLAEALPNEQKRVRELLPLYDEIPTGVFAATMMRQALTRAEQAAKLRGVEGIYGLTIKLSCGGLYPPSARTQC